MRLLAADCVCVSGFCGVAAPDPAGGIRPRTPSAHPTSKPGLRHRNLQPTKTSNVEYKITSANMYMENNAVTKLDIAASKEVLDSPGFDNDGHKP